MTVLTVITVVKDDPVGLRLTLDSLLSQDLSQSQVVVLDGSSDPRAVRDLLAEFPSAAIECHWREPRGVYPAMNDGIALATGRYVHFLNAGDAYVDSDVVAQVLGHLDSTKPLWAYGTVRFVAESGAPVATPTWHYQDERRHWFARGRFPAHQGVFVATDELRRQGGFDTSYRIVADYASILKCSLLAAPLELGLTVAEFREGGLSSAAWREGLREFHRARREILRPRGLAALAEQAYSARALMATTAYRALWAEGRPAHAAMARLR